MAGFIKDPGDYLDYGFDHTAWLAGDSILTSTWAIEPADATLTLSNSTFDPVGKTTIWVADGVAGQQYKLVNHIVTTEGRQKDRSFRLTVREV